MSRNIRYGGYRANPVNWLAVAFIACVTASIFAAIFMGVFTRNMSGRPVGKSWARTVFLEKYDWESREESDSSDYPSVPHGARNVKRWTSDEEITSVDEDGYPVTVGYYTEYHVSYEIKAWQYSRAVGSVGEYPTEPYWPTFSLMTEPKERESGTTESYEIKFRFKKPSGKAFDSTYKTKYQGEYDAIKLDHRYACKVNYFNVILEVRPTN